MARPSRSNAGVISSAEMERLLAKPSPLLLLERAREAPDKVALREKHLGIYRGTTWSEYRDRVEEIALGLAELGAARGDRIAIMGDPCPEWAYADMAVMALGGVTVGVYPTSAPVEVEHVISDSGASFFIAETQEHLDKLLAVIDKLPEIRRIVVIDTRALFDFEHPLVLPLEKLRGLGRARRDRRVGELESWISAIAPEDPAAIVYTSGTTGAPKGAVLRHRSLIAGAVSYINCKPDIRDREHRTVAHLPLSHVVARVIVVTTPLISELIPFFCEEIDDFAETIREVAPTFMVMPPRFYEKFAAQLLVGIETSTPAKRMAYRLASAVGDRVCRLRQSRQAVSPGLRLAYWLARQLVFRHLLEKVGFCDIEIAFTGSAPMPPQVVHVWQSWGVDLREVYGVTECCGISVAQYEPFPAPGDIGWPANLPGFECRVSEDGELMLRSPMVFAGYWRNPEATADALDADGWYHTGDVVKRTEDGRIQLVDRMKDILVTSGGKTLSPQQIEKALKGSPFISEAIVFGDGRRFITALLELDYTTVSEWARSFKLPYTSYTSLVTLPEVVKLIEGEVNRANEFLSRPEQVKKFRIIPVELDPEEGETTPTRKIKRGLMYEMFKDLIESMYQEGADRVPRKDFEKAAV